jgi:hypothetical protein
MSWNTKMHCCHYKPDILRQSYSAQSRIGQMPSHWSQMRLAAKQGVTREKCKIKQDRKGVLFGAHWNSKGVLHATSRAVTAAGYFDDNHGSKELWTCITPTRKGKKSSNAIQGHYCEPTITSVPTVATMCSNNYLVPIVSTMCCNNDPGSCGLPSSYENRDKQTDMDVP